jgi:hypothetical protein
MRTTDIRFSEVVYFAAAATTRDSVDAVLRYQSFLGTEPTGMPGGSGASPSAD